MSSPIVRVLPTYVNDVFPSAQSAGTAEFISPVREHCVRLVELESSENWKNTEDGFVFPVAGVKVEKPLIVKVVGLVHVAFLERVGKAAVSERAGRARRRSEEVYMMDLSGAVTWTVVGFCLNYE
jgi:hypothetical protein